MKRLKKLIFLAAISLLIFISWRFLLPVFTGADSFLKITTGEIKSQLFLDGKLLGETPFLGEKLPSGDYTLRLTAVLPTPFEKQVEFSTPVTLTSRTLTAVNYEFGPNELFSSGDIRTFWLGEGLSVITTPKGADVWLDGEVVGKSPLSLNPNQGIHKLKITHEGFITRELEINIEQDLRLAVEVFLAASSFEQVTELKDSVVKLISLATSLDSLLDKPEDWSEGVFFFEKNVKTSFDVLIDKTGRTYFRDKAAWDKKVKAKNQVVIGYLGDRREKGLTTKAQEALEELKKGLAPIKEAAAEKQVQILATPTGTLNVRSGPGTSYNIVTKVKPGEKYSFLEEKTDWYKIKLTDKEGWISAQYAKKL